MGLRFKALLLIAVASTVFVGTIANAQLALAAVVGTAKDESGFTVEFALGSCDFSTSGSNRFFSLEPGYQLLLTGENDEGAEVELVITVLDETKEVDGIMTRVVEERESEDGELIEISRNYFVLCSPTNDIFYFGEEVDIYEDGEIVSHEGAWLAGEDAQPGIIIPSQPEVGDKYYQEVAPGVAEDRAEIISREEIVVTPAGRFENVLKVKETTPLEPGVEEFKYHAPGVGLIQDGELQLAEYTLPATGDIELKPSIRSVDVAGESIEVFVNSSSTISKFMLDEENKKVTFEVDDESGIIGMTEISIGRILEGPYTVTIDGQVIDDFEIIQAAVSGEDMIRMPYTPVSHEVAVAGTNVVPEFPLPVIGVVAAVLGLAILLGRSKQASNFIYRR